MPVKASTELYRTTSQGLATNHVLAVTGQCQDNYENLIDTRDVLSSTPSSHLNLQVQDDISRLSQAILLHEMLWDIFVSTFETRFALWLGRSCCPYLETIVVSVSI